MRISPAFVFDWQVTSIPPLSGPGETLGLEGHMMDSVAHSPEAPADATFTCANMVVYVCLL